MLIFNLKQLEAFVWVSDLGTFRKAAERLNTTQPNISARIASLEDALGVKLMNRDAASVRLTSKGEELLEHARTVLSEAENLLVAADRNVLNDGTLRLGVTELIAHTWLRDFLKRLKEAYPKIMVELTVDLSINLKSELFSRSIDLVFQNGPFQRKTSGSLDLGTYDWIWVSSPTLELPKRKSLSVADLMQHPILTHSRDTKTYHEIVAHLSEASATSPKLVPSSNLATCLHMTIDGMGLSTLPEAMILKELKNGELQKLNYEWVPEPMQFLARYDKKKSPKFVGLAAGIAADTAKAFFKG